MVGCDDQHVVGAEPGAHLAERAVDADQRLADHAAVLRVGRQAAARELLREGVAPEAVGERVDRVERDRADLDVERLRERAPLRRLPRELAPRVLEVLVAEAEPIERVAVGRREAGAREHVGRPHGGVALRSSRES